MNNISHNSFLRLELGEYEISLAEVAARMSEGQRQHMANHLFKHYDVAPQKLKKRLPPETVHVDGRLYVRSDA